MFTVITSSPVFFPLVGYVVWIKVAENWLYSLANSGEVSVFWLDLLEELCDPAVIISKVQCQVMMKANLIFR